MYQHLLISGRGAFTCPERVLRQQNESLEQLRNGHGWEAALYTLLNNRTSLFLVQVKLAQNDDIDLAEIRRGQTSIAEQLDVIQQELLAKIDKCKSQGFFRSIAVSIWSSERRLTKHGPRTHSIAGPRLVLKICRVHGVVHLCSTHRLALRAGAEKSSTYYCRNRRFVLL